MALVEVSDVAFGYSDRPLFENVTFRLESGDRAGLVAPNGAGKSTLLRLLAREAAPDRGSIVIARDKTVAHCRQSHELHREGTLRDALLGGFSDLVELRAELSRASELAAAGDATTLERLADVTDRYEHAGGHALEHRVEAIASRLGFSERDLDRPQRALSGGERGRLELGAVLARRADVLLLDEPTNHLDLETIGWLVEHLSSFSGAILVVSHDRAFLDALCPITLELGRETFRAYPLSYTDYHAARAEDLERERKLAEEQTAFVQKTEDFIRRNIAGQKTKQAQSRRRMLEKLERKGRPEDVWSEAGKLSLRFADAPRSGDIVLEARGLAARRGERQLFENLELLVRRKDRIGIIGPNGCGKTTLLRLLSGNGSGDDRGELKRGTQLAEGYFDQELGSLEPKRTGVEEVRSIRGDFNVDVARQYLARFRFYGDDPLRQVESFSGGERTRLCLAKLLLEPRNLLFLDEPTNHLDIPATEILEEALRHFDGTVVLVSHDRRFLENVTTRTLCFQDGCVDVYDGGFSDYVAALERQRNHREASEEKDAARSSAEDGAGRGEEYRARRAKAREREREQRRAEHLEQEIARSEAELARLRARLLEGSGSDWEKLDAWAREERALAAKVDRITTEWLELEDRQKSRDAG
ncbi:MAG TPA: ABC-F family ATP-binding cassette domain-containing protein [Polyangiaceae bacterium]